MAENVEIAIVGGGPAGATAALALARAGRDVALIETAPRPGPRIGETVPPDLRPLLDELGLWQAFVGAGHLPSSGSASAWGSDELVFRDALCHPQGGGWHLDRAGFDAMLADAAAAAGARALRGARCTGVAGRAGEWVLALSGEPKQLEARFVVDATGRSAGLARRLGACKLAFDRLVGVHASFELERTGGDCHTLVEAAEDGWWYAARVPGGRAVVCWLSDSDLVRGRGLARPAAWRARLGESRHARAMTLGERATSRLGLVSAASHCLEPVAGEGWLAVGDAASAFDPLASAGITLALRTAREAAGAIERHLGGEAGALAGYAAGVRRRFAGYLAGRREQYRAERRWPEAPFWARRQGWVAGGDQNAAVSPPLAKRPSGLS